MGNLSTDMSEMAENLWKVWTPDFCDHLQLQQYLFWNQNCLEGAGITMLIVYSINKIE